MADASRWSDPATIAALGAVAVTVINAFQSWFGRRAVKQEAHAASVNAAFAADKAQTADLKLDQIHEKADLAIAQNEQIDGKVDGNLGKMWDVVNRLVDQVETLSKAATEKAVIVATESAERRVRATDKQLPTKEP